MPTVTETVYRKTGNKQSERSGWLLEPQGSCRSQHETHLTHSHRTLCDLRSRSLSTHSFLFTGLYIDFVLRVKHLFTPQTCQSFSFFNAFQQFINRLLEQQYSGQSGFYKLTFKTEHFRRMEANLFSAFQGFKYMQKAWITDLFLILLNIFMQPALLLFSPLRSRFHRWPRGQFLRVSDQIVSDVRQDRQWRKEDVLRCSGGMEILIFPFTQSSEPRLCWIK